MPARCGGCGRGLLLRECQERVEAGTGARRGAIGCCLRGPSSCRISAAEDQVQRGGLRVGEKGTSSVYGGPSAGVEGTAGAGGCGRRVGDVNLPHSYCADAGGDGAMKRLAWAAMALAGTVCAYGAAERTVRIEFSNPGLNPATGTLGFDPDGGGRF